MKIYMRCFVLAAPFALVVFVAGCWGGELTQRIMDLEPGEPDAPVVLYSTSQTISVRYTSGANPPQHTEAEELVEQHCNGPFDGKRELRHGWYTIEAKCR